MFIIIGILMILVNNQLDAQFFMYIYFYSLRVSASHVPIIRRIIVSWWWAHCCLKHVENRNKHTWKIVHQVGYLQGSYQDARSTKHKILVSLSNIPQSKKRWPIYMHYILPSFKYSTKARQWSIVTVTCSYSFEKTQLSWTDCFKDLLHKLTCLTFQ